MGIQTGTQMTLENQKRKLLGLVAQNHVPNLRHALLPDLPPETNPDHLLLEIDHLFGKSAEVGADLLPKEGEGLLLSNWMSLAELYL